MTKKNVGADKPIITFEEDNTLEIGPQIVVKIGNKVLHQVHRDEFGMWDAISILNKLGFQSEWIEERN